MARLKYREVDYAPLVWEVSVGRETGFAGEPAPGSAGAFRGVLCLGADTNQFLPFMWDKSRATLRLDLNRNRDFTDDPGGLFTGTGRDVQLFRGLRLAFHTTQGAYQVMVDAHVFGGPGNVRVFLYVRSLWEGAIELNGKKWYVAVVDRPDGRIGPTRAPKETGDRMLLRSWEEREQVELWWHATLERIHGFSHVKLVTFPYRYAGNAEVIDAFNLPGEIFLGGQAYRLACRIEPDTNPADLELGFVPVKVPLAKLQIGGEAIRRVVLDSIAPEGFSVVLDRPAAEVEVPAGDYPRQIVLLQKEGETNIAAGIGGNRLSIGVAGVTRWHAGAPITNGVEIAANSGGSVSLRYLAANASGIPFHLEFQDKNNPPRVEISQAASVLAQGRFEFG